MERRGAGGCAHGAQSHMNSCWNREVAAGCGRLWLGPQGSVEHRNTAREVRRPAGFVVCAAAEEHRTAPRTQEARRNTTRVARAFYRQRRSCVLRRLLAPARWAGESEGGALQLDPCDLPARVRHISKQCLSS